MITISIQGQGTFQISAEKLPQLLAWLATNSGVRTAQENTTYTFQGKDLIKG